MGGKKKGGSAHTPYEAPNTLHSKQIVKILDVLSEGPVEGLANGNTHPFKSIFFNDTPVQAENRSFNFQGFELAINDGDKDQTYLPGFDVVEKTVQVGVDVKRDTPINRTVSDPYVSSVRVTVGVKSLVEMKDNGDRLPTSVSMTVSLVKNGNYYASQVVSMHEKGTEPFYQDVTFNDLPEAPFEIRVTRNTPDSKTDKLQNATIFPSYVEIIDAKLSYQYLAMAGYKFDAMQFGSSLPRINTLLKGKIVPIPTNYDPVNRVYSGLWDGSFKMGWTDNPAWIVYEFAINKLYGGKLDPRFIDRASLYRVSQFCDELVDDGYGGKERRVTFNAYYTDSKPFRERLQEMCSSFFGKAIWNGQYVTFTLDIDDDPVAVYTNANVIDGDFSYEGISNSAVITTVNVQYYDAKDGYRQKTEVVEDYDLLRRYRTNVEKVIAEGCTSRSQAHRLGRYILEKSRLRTTVNFKVGAEGLRHRPFDVIQIADNHLAGANIGGRVLDVAGDIITLDRDVENAKDSKFSYLGVIDNKIKKIELEVTDQIAPNKLKLKEGPADLRKFSAWSIARSDVKPKYYRALAISPGNDGTFSIKAIEHELGLHERLANGLQFERDPNSVWSSFPVISNSTVGNNGDEVIITWDNINADTTSLTYTVKLYKDGKLYRTYSDLREPVLRFDNLPSGTYVAEVQAKNNRGQLSNILKQYFDLNYTITALTTHSELFAVKIKWQLPTIVNTSISTEIWRAEKDDINEARLLVTLPYPQSEYPDSGMSATDSYYYWVRIIDKNGRTGEFTRSMRGEPKTDPSDITDILDEAIGEKQISKELQEQFDSNIDDRVEKAKEEIKSEIDGIEIDLTGINSEIDNIKSEAITTNSNLENVKESAEKALSDAEKNAQAIKGQSTVIDEVKTSQDQSEASWQLAQMSNVSAQRSNFARSMTMGAQVARNIAKIDEIDSFVVTEQSATATRFTQINARVDNAESKITSVETSLTSDIKAEASKREALEAVFDLSKAQQQLQLMAQSTADQSLSSRLFSMSASTANANAKYDELQEVVVTNEEARIDSEQKLQAEIDSSKADITRIDRVMTSGFSSQAVSIHDLSVSLDSAKADIKTVEQAIVNNEKSQTKRYEELNTQISENEANQQLLLLSESGNSHSLSQRYFSLSAQTANSSAKIQTLEKVFSDSKTAWAVTEERLQSEIDSSKSEISRLDKTIAENNKTQSVAISNLTSKINKTEADIASVKSTQASDKQSLTQEINSAKSEWRESNEVKYLTSSDVEKTPREYADLYGRTTIVEFGNRAHFGLDEGTYHTVTTTISYLTGLDRGRVTQRAVSNDFAVTVRERKSASDDTWTPWVEIEDVAGAQRKADEAQKEAVRISKASIDSLAKTQANDKKALTEQINSANSNINNHSASITEIRKTQADTAGKVASMWTMKVDGNGVIGGIMLGSDGHESMLKFAADNFVISTGDQSRNLFTIQRVNNRQVAVLNVNDFILPGSLSAEAIRANTKLSSPRIEGGTITGSSLNIGNGACTIQYNGDFYARNGTFEGTVFADKIRGDVVQMFTLSSVEKRDRLIFKIPSDTSDRYLYIPRIAVGMRLSGTGSQVSHLRLFVDIDESNVFNPNATTSSSYIMTDIDRYTGSVYTRLISLGGVTHRIQKGRECFITIRAEYTDSNYNPEVYIRVRNGVILTTKSQNLLSPIN